ncbi:MAG: hydroxymethylbilane synthase, partial [Limnobacter sp.]
YASLAELPEGAVVGSSSLRRQAQVLARYPHLKVEPLRGNLDTRLAKLDSGHYQAIVLAAAGLKRLGLHSRIRNIISSADMLPAVGQGALGLEIRAGDSQLAELVKPLIDPVCTA